MENQNLVVHLDRVWTAFPADVFAGLQKAWAAGHRVIELVLQSDPDIPYMRYYTKYFIDFNDMKQFNAYTSKTRKIKFIPFGQDCAVMKGKLAKMKDIAVVPNKEKYTRETDVEVVPEATAEQKRADECAIVLMYLNRTWLRYPPDVMKTLQQSYIDGVEMVEFVMLSDPNIPHMKFYTKYKVDFGDMLQMNSYTEKSRKIKFVPKSEVDANGCDYPTIGGLLARDATAIKTIECDNAGKVEFSPVAAPLSNALDMRSSGSLPSASKLGNGGHKGRSTAGTAHDKYERLKEQPRNATDFSRSPFETQEPDLDRSNDSGPLLAGTRKPKVDTMHTMDTGLPVGSPNAREKQKFAPKRRMSTKALMPKRKVSQSIKSRMTPRGGKGGADNRSQTRQKQHAPKKRVKDITIVLK